MQQVAQQWAFRHSNRQLGMWIDDAGSRDVSPSWSSKHGLMLQVFPKMANYTNTHKMTGVGNALKRHYQALCLDYELAHPNDLTRQVGRQCLPCCVVCRVLPGYIMTSSSQVCAQAICI